MFIIIFLIIFVFFISFLSIVRNNIIIWWRVFLIITVAFIFLNKGVKSYSSLINYFIIQERLGLIFLLINFGIIQFFIVLIKIGVAPLHFWVFRVTNNIFRYNLIWFLTFQKLPFLIILLQIFWLGSFMLLFLGLIICYFQIYSIKNYKNLLVLSSTESFNWIIIGLFLSVFNTLYLFLYYIFLIIILIRKFRKSRVNFLNWETILVFLNIPFRVTFFVKIFSLRELINFNSTFLILVLFTIFLSVLTFRYWLVNIRVKLGDFNQNNNKVFYFLIYPLIVIRIIYFSSKIILYYLDKVKFLLGEVRC